MKIMQNKDEETKILKGVSEETNKKGDSIDNLSFTTLDTNVVIKMDKEISFDEEPVRDEEKCPSIQLSVIDKWSFKRKGPS